MPKITLTLGAATYSHDVSNADATRIINAIATDRGIPATPAAVCPVIARELFQSLKDKTRRAELNAVAVADISATES